MKVCFFSDIHGVPSALQKFLDAADALSPDLLVLLGDVLYHGPRNGVPDFYDPVRVADLLNARSGSILAVRGNCDADIDQAMLSFPIMSDCSELDIDGRRFFLTHGHIWNFHSLPPLPPGSFFAQGHTHIPAIERLPGGVTGFNPGSISLPKGGSKPSFGFFDGSDVSIREL